MTDHFKKSTEEEIPADIVEDGTVEALGYEVSYKRVLRTIANVCWVISLTAPMGAVLIMAVYQISYGGFWGLTWGWILPSIIFTPQVLAVGELCSSMPVNGANYWWTAALAPPEWSRLLSFVSGCTTVVSLFTSVASYAYASAASLSLCAMVYGSDWEVTLPQEMGLAMGIVVLWALGLTLRLDKVGWLMVVCSIIPLVQMVIYLVALPVAHSHLEAPFASAADVFGKYTNYSDWTPGVAVPMTWFAAVWANGAWQAPAYIVEGTHDARRVTPKSMLMSYTIAAVAGAIICITSAFCINDMDALAMDESGYPLVLLFAEHWGAGPSFAFMLVGTIATIFGGCGWLLALAFQLSAFARDGGLPLAGYVSHVNKRTNTPTYAALVLTVGSILILLLSLSSLASSVIYSLAVIVSSIMLSLPIALRVFAGTRWVPGPWNLGSFSIPVHIFAFLAQVYLVIMESFPLTQAWTVDTFNYNWIVAVITIILAVALYALFGSHYKGIDLAALERFREDHVIIEATPVLSISSAGKK